MSHETMLAGPFPSFLLRVSSFRILVVALAVLVGGTFDGFCPRTLLVDRT